LIHLGVSLPPLLEGRETPNNLEEIVEDYGVVYASAGCLPDSEDFEFVGTLEQCELWIVENLEEFVRPDYEHDLYELSIVMIEGV
tara:strand:+ start:745 stop:999 length:255 start_codon:yes stop_codon:yes gene_type:complete